MRSKLYYLAAACIAVLVAGFIVTIVTCISLDLPVDRNAPDVMYTVPRGASVSAIAGGLSGENLVRSSRFAYFYSRFFNLTLKAGTYKLSAAMKTSQILRYLHDGRQEYLKVTVPEGLSLSKTAKHLEDAGVVNADDFIAAAANGELLRKFNIHGKDAEGFLFPDTYFFSYENDAVSVVTTMIENFFTKTSALENVPADPAELYRKVILASIIEREYRVAGEAPLISSVFTNRLTIGMGLQSCATVEYIITEIMKLPHPTRLTLDDLAIQSDYNTYLWAGLPPGPIASPGLVALEAAFKPADTHYLYFRLTDADSGTHTFTRSLDEHVEAGHHLVLKKAAGD